MDRGSASDGPSSHIDGQRLSPSLPPQLWGSFSPPTASRHPFLPSDLSVDETTRAQRTAALRQLHGNPRNPPRKHRQTKSIGSRSSLSSQPVIVRSYTPDHSPSGSGPSSSTPRPRMDQNGTLPPINEFTIDGILKAIEPDIRGTLDEIARICGRSRLSLANEYDSHMPPQGEIRASGRIPLDHTLLPVEEASSSNERLASEMPVILGDDSSLDDRRDFDPTPTYGLLESLRAAQRYHAAPSSSWGDGSSMQVDHDIQRPISVDDSALPAAPHPTIDPPLLRERGMRSKSANWPILQAEKKAVRIRPGEVVTSQPVFFEVRFEAQGGHSTISRAHRENKAAIQYGETHHDENPYLSSMTYDTPSNNTYSTSTLRQRIQNLSIVNEAQNWLHWLNGSYGRLSEGDHQTAENNLRAILERHAIADGSVYVPEERYEDMRYD
jgi:hypothetical protein